MLESVQQKATKMVQGFKQMLYKERLQHLKLPILTCQRKYGKMIMAHKIMSRNISPGLLLALPHQYVLWQEGIPRKSSRNTPQSEKEAISSAS